MTPSETALLITSSDQREADRRMGPRLDAPVPLLPGEDEDPLMDFYGTLASSGSELMLSAGCVSQMLSTDAKPSKFDLDRIERHLTRCTDAVARYKERAL